METQFQDTVLRGLLMNKSSLLHEADEIARIHAFSEETLFQCQMNIFRWLRYHSVAPLLQSEADAIIKIQAKTRAWLVRKKLYVHLNMLINLCKGGAHVYAKKAHVYQMLTAKK